MENIALFEVEPIGVDGALEANGRVYHFCSTRCRNMFAVDAEYNPGTEYHEGTSPDAIPCTVCDECGVALLITFAPEQQLRTLSRDVLPVLKAILAGYDYNPGSSDLDDEQPINVRMTLGVYRRADRLHHEVSKCL